jgi:hypothetical protein
VLFARLVVEERPLLHRLLDKRHIDSGTACGMSGGLRRRGGHGQLKEVEGRPRVTIRKTRDRVERFS